MKVELDDGNYQLIITKLTKGSIQDKANSLKKLLFLYENFRAKIYLYQRRITQSLQLLLLIEENDISLNALSLIQKIIINTAADSDLALTIKKRLLNKIVLNLGSVEINLRKISHKCILEYVRKFKDYQTVISTYIRIAIHQADNYHLKLKSINSLHSLLMNQNKYFSHNLQSSLHLIQQLISTAHVHQNAEVRKAALLCLIYLLRMDGSENNLKAISAQSQKQLFSLTFVSDQLASLLEAIMKYKYTQQSEADHQINNAPSPKFLKIDEDESKEQKGQKNNQKSSDCQMRVYNDVSNAEEFLRKIQSTEGFNLQQIKEFSIFIQKYLVDQSIKLFSISKKIVETIFDSEQGKNKQYYVVLVPCIVNGIGNKRFIVRKNLDKLVRQYLKFHTQIWVDKFIDRFSMTNDPKIKQMLMDLFIHAYKTSPEFYYPTEKAFSVFDVQINDRNSNLKWKVIDCVLLVIERQNLSEKSKEDALTIFSSDAYNKIIRKMNKGIVSVGSHKSGLSGQPQSPLAGKRSKRGKRLVTDEACQAMLSAQKIENERKDNVSEGKVKNILAIKLQRGQRKSQIDINFKPRRVQIGTDKKSKEERSSLEKLPQLKKNKGSYLSKNQQIIIESPVKKNIGQRSLMYIEKQNLKQIIDPKNQLDRILISIKDNSWNTQFESVNILRSIIEFHQELINDQYLSSIVNELLQCLNSLRSGVTKISLICLGQLIQKFGKRLYQFTQLIISTILKKSAITSQFIQQQMRRCLLIAVEGLCLNRLISSVNGLRDNKAIQIKINILLIIDTIIKNQKIYKKQVEWIWGLIIEYHQEPHNDVRNQCKKIVKWVIQNYKDWKNDVIIFKKHVLDKIQKILKTINSKGTLLESQNLQFEKLLASKVMTSKYFSSQYYKFEEQDKIYTAKKNWKDRIRLLNDMFNSAFQHPTEFQTNSNCKKYILVACQQIDQKNPGLLLNALNIISKSIDYIPTSIQECQNIILQRCLNVIQSKRNQLVIIAQKVLLKIYKKFDINKILRDLLKIVASNNLRIKNQAINQIISIVNEYNISNNFQVLLIKVLNKLIIDKNTQLSIKLKELLALCVRKLSPDFLTKIKLNEKLCELVQ